MPEGLGRCVDDVTLLATMVGRTVANLGQADITDRRQSISEGPPGRVALAVTRQRVIRAFPWAFRNHRR